MEEDFFKGREWDSFEDTGDVLSVMVIIFTVIGIDACEDNFNSGVIDIFLSDVLLCIIIDSNNDIWEPIFDNFDSIIGGFKDEVLFGVSFGIHIEVSDGEGVRDEGALDGFIDIGDPGVIGIIAMEDKDTGFIEIGDDQEGAKEE